MKRQSLGPGLLMSRRHISLRNHDANFLWAQQKGGRSESTLQSISTPILSLTVKYFTRRHQLPNLHVFPVFNIAKKKKSLDLDYNLKLSLSFCLVHNQNNAKHRQTIPINQNSYLIGNKWGVNVVL